MKTKPTANYVFSIGKCSFLGAEYLMVTISDRKYFEENNCCSDWELDGEPFSSLDLLEESEGAFSSTVKISVDELRAKLNASPELYECPEFNKFLREL
jgi:hypothetical protein